MSKYTKYKKVNEKWVNEIPDHWSYSRGKICFYTIKEKNTNNKNGNVLSLTYKGVIRNDKNNPIGLAPSDYSTYQIFDKDDLVFKLIDLNNIKTSRVGIVPENGIMSSAYIRLCKRNNINVKYFYYQYYDLYLKNVYNSLGGGVRQTLNAGELLNIKICIPPREEQDKIEKFLDWKINQIITLSYKLMEKNKYLIELKKTIITKLMFDNKSNNSNYQTRRLKYMLKSKLQYGANETGIVYDEALPRYIRITDIDSNNELKFDNMRSLPIDKLQNYILQDGDILFARSGATAGKTFLYKKEYGLSAFAGYLIRAQVDESICLPEYVYLMTLSKYYQDWKDSIFIQTTIQNISADKYYNFLVKFPSIEEQTKIINEVKNQCSKIDILISKNKQRMYEIESIKQRIISDVITGRISVQNINISEYVSQNEIYIDGTDYDEENENTLEVDE